MDNWRPFKITIVIALISFAIFSVDPDSWESTLILPYIFVLFTFLSVPIGIIISLVLVFRNRNNIRMTPWWKPIVLSILMLVVVSVIGLSLFALSTPLSYLGDNFLTRALEGFAGFVFIALPFLAPVPIAVGILASIILAVFHLVDWLQTRAEAT